MNVQTLGVVGAGQMGNGIAQVAASVGLKVIMVDVAQAAIDKGMATISTSADRLIKKEKITEADKKTLLGNISCSTAMTALGDCDMIVEAATENIELKLKIFKQLDEIAKPGAIMCTNTSSISVTKIAASTRRPEMVAGMHFMNPVPLMLLVEGIRGLQTSDATFKDVRALAEKMG